MKKEIKIRCRGCRQYCGGCRAGLGLEEAGTGSVQSLGRVQKKPNRLGNIYRVVNPFSSFFPFFSLSSLFFSPVSSLLSHNSSSCFFFFSFFSFFFPAPLPPTFLLPSFFLSRFPFFFILYKKKSNKKKGRKGYIYVYIVLDLHKKGITTLSSNLWGFGCEFGLMIRVTDLGCLISGLCCWVYVWLCDAVVIFGLRLYEKGYWFMWWFLLESLARPYVYYGFVCLCETALCCFCFDFCRLLELLVIWLLEICCLWKIVVDRTFSLLLAVIAGLYL